MLDGFPWASWLLKIWGRGAVGCRNHHWLQKETEQRMVLAYVLIYVAKDIKCSKATKYVTVKSYSNVYKWSFCAAAAAARRSKRQDKSTKHRIHICW